MQWVKLRRENEWGREYFVMPDGGHKDEVVWNDDSLITIRWPDGTVEQTRIKSKQFDTLVGDMGQTYNVSFRLPGFYANVHGVTLWFALDTVEVHV